MKFCQPTQVKVVRVQACGWLAQSPGYFGLFELRRDCANDAHRHAILKIENVIERTFVSVCPDVVARPGIDELRCNAYAIARLADAAFQHVTDAKPAAD